MHLSAPVRYWLENLPGLLGRGTDPNTEFNRFGFHPLWGFWVRGTGIDRSGHVYCLQLAPLLDLVEENATFLKKGRLLSIGLCISGRHRE